MMQLIPLIILVLALLTDTFYFSQLCILYKVIPIGILLIISAYLKYSFKYAEEQYILGIENDINRIRTNCDPRLPLTQDPQDNTYYLPLKTFIFFHVFRLGNGYNGYSCHILASSSFIDKHKEKHDIPKNRNLTFNEMDNMDKELDKIINIMISLRIHINEYYYAEGLDKCNYARIIIFSLYLKYLFYILLLSFYTLPIDFKTHIINIGYIIFITGLLSISYIYCYFMTKTDQIYDLINTIEEDGSISKENIDIERYQNKYKVGMLRIHKDTNIPVPIQMYLVVMHVLEHYNDEQQNQPTVIGYLSTEVLNENDKNYHKVSDNPYIQDIDNGLYFNELYYPILINLEDFEINKKATEYIQDPLIIKKLIRLEHEILEYESVLYEPETIYKKNIMSTHRYEAGVLFIYESTELPVDIQMRLVVVYIKNGIYIVIGYMNYENKKTLSNLDEDEAEIKSMTSVIPPLLIKREQFTLNKEVTDSVQDLKIIGDINEIRDKVLNHETVEYDPIGITIEEIDNCREKTEVVMKQYKDEFNENREKYKAYYDQLDKLATMRSEILNQYLYIEAFIYQLLNQRKRNVK